MAIAENKQVKDTMPSFIKVDMNSTILVRPTVVVKDASGNVDATKSGLGTPVPITLEQLKAMLAAE